MHLVCSGIHTILNHWIAILIIKLPHCISITGWYSTGMTITTGRLPVYPLPVNMLLVYPLLVDRLPV